MNVRGAGETFGFRAAQPDAGWPDAWRPLDRAVWRWVVAHGGDATTATAAAWASQAEGRGHSALPLSGADGSPPFDAAQRETLACSPLVATMATANVEPEAGCPFVLDGGYLYLRRNHRAEAAVAIALSARRTAGFEPRCPLSDDDLRALFNGSWTNQEASQRDAVRQAVGKRLMVLTGGPGTGKTTTVLRMLMGLSRDHAAAHDRLPWIHIAAPTGKAAQRLGAALRQGEARLLGGERPLASEWRSHLEAIVSAESGTVHRLLGSRGGRGGFSFHVDEQLPADIVVVDEASMLDLGLLRALLAALRETAVLVLVGDADQLTSVGTGSIMLDIVSALEADPRGDLVRLSHCFRADRHLVPINEAVRAGATDAFKRALATAGERKAASGHPAAAEHAVADAAGLRRRLRPWVEGLRRTLEAVAITRPVAASDQPALAMRLAALRRQQLLCAQREGPFGSVRVAEAIAARLRGWQALEPWFSGDCYPGRSVIVTRNDPASRLYNGDVGLCVLVEGGGDAGVLKVVFESTQAAVPGAQTGPQAEATGVRLFDPRALPPHEDAFALTVHKSQGSEYDHVAVLLPPDPNSPLLARQMLYTGLSRARLSVELWATDAAVETALARPSVRHGRLAQRIRQGPLCDQAAGGQVGRA